MKTTSAWALLLAGVVVIPALPAQAVLTEHAGSASLLLARGGGGSRGGGGRGGGGSGGRGGGGGRMGGGSRGGSVPRGGSGFSGAGGGLNRGSSRPTGGWSNSAGGGARPSLDRPRASRDGARPSSGGTRDLSRSSGGQRAGNRTPSSGRPAAGSRDLGANRNGSANRDLGANRNLNRSGDRTINRDGSRDVNRDFNRNTNRNVNRDVNRNWNRDVNRNWNRTVNIDNVNLHPGWARPGWGVARPWNYGWYGGWSTPTWGWWGARAAAWGVGTLATAAIINNAVDSAVNSNQTYIVVPSTNYQLLFGTVQPTSSSGVSFAVTADGTTFELTADCNSGLLDGREPQSAAEAELLNAACQVAYGTT